MSQALLSPRWTRTHGRGRRFGTTARWLGLTLVLSGCGGGGGGGGGGTKTFQLEEVLFGRVLETAQGLSLVSPLTTVDVDPESGLAEESSLLPIDPGVDPTELVRLRLGTSYQPRVVPRDAGLLLRFDSVLDPTSLVPDRFDENGKWIEAGSIQLATAEGEHLATELRLLGEKEVLLRLDPDALPFLPASPLAFDTDLRAALVPGGSVLLLVPSTGSHVPRDQGGRRLAARADRLGESTMPIGLHPGNPQLDFVAENDLLPGANPSHGFLPTRRAPRIVRTHRVEARLDFADGDHSGAQFLEDADADFDVLARDGAGEWAGARLILRPGGPDELERTVVRNGSSRIEWAQSADPPPRDGDRYRLERLEYFEPNLAHPLDPDRFDPRDPENDRNQVLRHFLVIREIDARGDAFGPALDPLSPLPAYCEIGLRFDQPMSEHRLSTGEAVRVTLDPDPGPDADLLTRLVLDESQTFLRIQPVRVDPTQDSAEAVGFGPGVRSLRLHLRSLPDRDFLLRQMGRSGLQALLDEGATVLQSAAGLPLAVPTFDFDAADPFTVYSEHLSTDESVSSTSPPPVSLDWRVMVHRFQGLPFASTDPATHETGWRFRDRAGTYHPLADVLEGPSDALSAQPVQYLTKVHDDFQPPPDSTLTAQASGLTAPLLHQITSQDGAAPWPHRGARFQHLYRDVDCFPGTGLAGSQLDLYRVSFAPAGGNVTTDVYDDVSIHVGLSPFRPITQNDGAGLYEPGFGLTDAFDHSTFESIWLGGQSSLCPGVFPVEGPNHLPSGLVTCVPAGTSLTLSATNLFTPSGTQNRYHPWPNFRVRFGYDSLWTAEQEAERLAFNVQAGAEIWKDRRKKEPLYDNRGGNSLLVEYRIRPQSGTLSGRNSFAWSLGDIVSTLPNYRVFSRGTASSPLFPDDVAGDVRARCAVGGLGGVVPGDNSRYFATFDYVKVLSRITTPFVAAYATSSPEYFPAIVFPPEAARHGGTRVVLEYRGANDAAGAGATDFASTPDVADGYDHLRLRLGLYGDVPAAIAPALECIQVPYRR